MICLDSTFLIDYLRGDAAAIKKAESLIGRKIATTSVNCFEVLAGLVGNRNVPKGALEVFSEFIASVEVLELDYRASGESAKIFSVLSLQGKQIEGSDCMIAGTMLSHGCSEIITRNKKHFSRIRGIKVEVY